ncbi:hypothetical protein ACQWG3_24600, partial [Salmonella enterica subsp. enterica serovar Infantis]
IVCEYILGGSLVAWFVDVLLSFLYIFYIIVGVLAWLLRDGLFFMIFDFRLFTTGSQVLMVYQGMI